MIIAEKLGSDISSLPDYESYYNEGDTGELVVYLQKSLNYEEMEQLETEICGQGAVLTTPIQQDARMLVIRFKKAIAPLAIIVGALAVVAVMIIGWQLFKAVSAIPTWAWILGGLAGTYCIFRLVRRNK